MKIILNEAGILEYMKKNGIKNYRQLCRECGLNYNTFMTEKCKSETFSKETFWLIADFLKCHVEDIQKVEWKK